MKPCHCCQERATKHDKRYGYDLCDWCYTKWQELMGKYGLGRVRVGK